VYPAVRAARRLSAGQSLGRVRCLLEWVGHPDIEFGRPTAVVVVAVGEHEGRRPAKVVCQLVRDRRQTKAAVDEQRFIATVDDEEVPADELGRMGLGHERHAVADVLGLKPPHSYHSRGAHLTRSTLGS
jgi:hypothetical protein